MFHVSTALLTGVLIIGPVQSQPAPGPFRRVIASAPNNAEIVCALGAEDLLVGVSPYATFPSSLATLPKIGGIQDPDLEQILALRPDLLILRGRFPQVEKLCAARDIAIYYDQTDTLPSLYQTITDIGRLLDRTAQAQQLVESIRTELAKIRSATANGSRPRVLLTVRSPDRLADITSVGGRSYLDTLIEIAGGNNMFGDLDAAYPHVSLEEIIARDPEVILEAMPGEDLTESAQDKLFQQWKAVGTLTAVRHGRVHWLTADYVLVPSPRVTLLASKLQALLAPDLLPATKTKSSSSPTPAAEAAAREP